MPKLTIVAQIQARPNQVELVQAELEKLIPVTRQEKGCIQYDLHCHNDDPNHFLFFELWESRELWQAHMNAQHIQDFVANTDGAIADLTIFEMTPIG